MSPVFYGNFYFLHELASFSGQFNRDSLKGGLSFEFLEDGFLLVLLLGLYSLSFDDSGNYGFNS